MRLFASRKSSYLVGLFLLLVILVIYLNNPILKPNNIDAFHITGEPANLAVVQSAVVKTHSVKSKYANIKLDDLRVMVKSGDKGALEELASRMGVEKRGSGSDVYASYSGTKAQENELWAWREARGYVRDSAGAQYGSYNHEALSTLMNSGDVLALEEMTRRLLDVNYIKAVGLDVSSALDLRAELVYKAAVYGSTKSLATLGADVSTSKAMGKGSPEMKLAKIDEFAWYAVAAKRGDLMPLYSSVALLSGLYEISFTENDWALVSNKADLLYGELEQKRVELGLGGFDNSVPETVRNFFDSLYPRPKDLPGFMP